ncbi:MAG: hypothetical protein EU551_02170 [Promethearchaeota archaeon]|nr:MAG: hypothetical protein EU551_02170 [Candidatus Lokiarchaeota archaeon]
MKLKDHEEFWNLYRFVGDFFGANMKEDAKEKFGDFLEGEIVALIEESPDPEFKYGYLVRKQDGYPYLFIFLEQLDVNTILTAKVNLIKE